MLYRISDSLSRQDDICLGRNDAQLASTVLAVGMAPRHGDMLK